MPGNAPGGGNQNEAKNLVSDVSFRKIFMRDFATVSGTNNLPNGQFTLKLNKPELEFGQILRWYPKGRSQTIPLLSLKPYISVGSNDDEDFIVATTSKFDPKVGVGGRIIFIPQALSSDTYYFFKRYSGDLKTRTFVDKNDLLKKELKEKYEGHAISTATVDAEISVLDTQLLTSQLLLRFQQSPNKFLVDVTSSSIQLIETSTGQLLTLNLAEIKKLLIYKHLDFNELDSISDAGSQSIGVTFGTSITTFPISSLFDDVVTLTKAIPELKRKRFAKAEEKVKLDELRIGTKKELKKFLEDTVYAAEKDAPWTKRILFWLALDINGRNQSVNIFRQDTVQENQLFRKNVFGLSANIASFTKEWAWKASATFDRSTINKFFDDTPKTFMTESPVASGAYKVTKSMSAYDVNSLSEADFNTRVKTSIWTVEGTLLYGETKKYGITANYTIKARTKEANLRAGLVLPVILDDAKGEQSNIIFELVIPDIHAKKEENAFKQQFDGETPWKRGYFNIKVAIPINLLTSI